MVESEMSGVPRFSSRYSFVADLNKTDMSPVTKALKQTRLPVTTHWSIQQETTDVFLPSGQKQTLEDKPFHFYIESGDLTCQSKAQQDEFQRQQAGGKDVEAEADKAVEDVLRRFLIRFNKEPY